VLVRRASIGVRAGGEGGLGEGTAAP